MITPVDEIEEPQAGALPRCLFDALQGAASLGLVEIWEAGMRDWSYLDALLEVRERTPLPLRVRLLIAAGLAERGMRPRTGDKDLEIEGVKFYSDGWMVPRTCAMSAPFADEPANQGLLFESPHHLARRIEPFAREHWRIATHAIGDAAIESVLDAYEMVYGSDCPLEAPRIEHAQVLRPDLVDRMSSMGVVVCIQPGFGLDDAGSAEVGLADHWPLAYRWSSLLDAGVSVVTGSDYPIDQLAPLLGLRKLTANPFDRMDLETAFRLMTNSTSGSVLFSRSPLDPLDDSPTEIVETIPSM